MENKNVILAQNWKIRIADLNKSGKVTAKGYREVLVPKDLEDYEEFLRQRHDQTEIYSGEMEALGTIEEEPSKYFYGRVIGVPEQAGQETAKIEVGDVIVFKYKQSDDFGTALVMCSDIDYIIRGVNDEKELEKYTDATTKTEEKKAKKDKEKLEKYNEMVLKYEKESELPF